MRIGPPQIHNEYFFHSEPHNDAPSVSVRGKFARSIRIGPCPRASSENEKEEEEENV